MTKLFIKCHFSLEANASRYFLNLVAKVTAQNIRNWYNVGNMSSEFFLISSSLMAKEIHEEAYLVPPPPKDKMTFTILTRYCAFQVSIYC